MDPSAIAELDRRLGIPGVARVVVGNGGLVKVVIDAPAATGEMYLHGAHVTSWQPRGAAEVLFVSEKSRWASGKAIRGGVPVCFPWFAGKADAPQAPAHGVVRTVAWTLESIVPSPAGVTVSMSTDSNPETKKWQPADFHLSHRVTFGAELTMELEARNPGATPLVFEEALHAYFRVGQIDRLRIEGLAGTEYIDKTDANRLKTQSGPIVISAETDRVYLATQAAVELQDSALGRRLLIAKQNSHTTVVWNPWIEKTQALSDFGDDEWRSMVCIEASNVGASAITLAPGQQHQMNATVRV